MPITDVGLKKLGVKSVVVSAAGKRIILAAQTVLFLHGKVEITRKYCVCTEVATNVVGHGEDRGLSVQVITSMKITAEDVELAFGTRQVKVGSPTGFYYFPAGVPTFIWLLKAVQEGLLYPKANSPLMRGPMGPKGNQALGQVYGFRSSFQTVCLSKNSEIMFECQ